MAGCAATSNITIPSAATDIPKTFAAATEPYGPVDQRWWERFGDDRLNELIEEAITESPAVGQAIARSVQARAQAKIAGVDLLPQVSGTFGGMRQGQGSAASSTGTSTTSNRFDLGVDVSWEVDIWGRLSSQSAAARADFLASEENLRATRQAIAAQTARSYFATIESEQQVALSRRVVETFGEITRQISNRADVGIAAPNDKALAIANLQSATAGLAQREEGLERVRRQFEVLLRDYPDGTMPVAGNLPTAPTPPPAGLPAELLERRPDVHASELALRAAGYRATAAERSLLPSISLTGNAGTASEGISNLLDPAYFIWSIGGRLLQPIFQGGRLRAQVELREGQRDEALEAYADTVLNALSEVETALAVERQLAYREAALERAADAAEQSVAISFNRYRAGIDPFLTVLESQQRALDSRSGYLAARRARLENRIDLHLALGGGFETAPEFAPEEE